MRKYTLFAHFHKMWGTLDYLHVINFDILRVYLSILDWLIALLEAKLVAKKLLTSLLNCVRAAFAVSKVEHVRFLRIL